MWQNKLSYLPVASGFLVLVLALAVGVLTVANRGKELAVSQNVATEAAQEEAVLSLSPSEGEYLFDGKTAFPIGLILDSGGKSIDGVDVVINFDPAKIKIEGNKVAPTTLFEEFPLNKVDSVRGQVRFSALTFNPKPVTGIIGTFRLTPLVKGEVTMSFSFTPGATTDSNVAEHGTAKDILGKVENGRFVFK